MEIWDLYDKKRNNLNKTIIREKKAAPGQYHIVVGIWIINRKGELLITLRAPQKQAYPNLWENTGGSIQAGETSVDGALRELREETGIIISTSDLMLLDSNLETTAIVDQYLTIQNDIAIQDLRLQPTETVDAKWVPPEIFERMIADNLVAAPIAHRYGRVAEHVVQIIDRQNR